MNLSRFSIDPSLAAAAGADESYKSVFYDKLLSGLFEQDENLFLKADLEKDRAPILLFPVLYWLSSDRGEAGRRRVLYLCAERGAAEEAAAEAGRLLAALPGRPRPALLGGAGDDAAEAGGAELVVADLASLAAAIAAPEFQPRSFGFVVADQAELLAELPGELLRTVQGRLLPSWERKTLVVAGKHTPKAKNFAWDFADNPKEGKLSETMGYAGTMAAVSRDVVEADKIRFILGLLAKIDDRHLCVFCNLKSTAAELSVRLSMNGVASDYIAGNLNPDRKRQIVAKARGWTGRRSADEAEPAVESATEREAAPEAAEAPEVRAQPILETRAEPPAQPSRFPADAFVLVLTDEGAKGLPKACFSTLLNYDIPLEPELYFERLNLLDRAAPSAGLYNLVCERYMYGIPAIERLIDASLAVAPLADREGLPEDLSAGKPVDLPEPRRRFGRDRDGFGHDRRDDRRDRRDDGRGDGRREDRRGEGRGPRGDDRRGPRGEGRGGDRREGPAPERGAADPYALSMEERMALYRKKYGQTADRGEGRGRSPERAPSGPGRQDRPRGQGARPPRGREGGGRTAQGRPPEAQKAGAPRQNPMTAPAPEAPRGADPSSSAPGAARDEAPSARPKGLFGRLQGILGGKKPE